ncbi:MAG TPA: metalloregulator ArsR/SmtB family transcription factor [Fulvivirga sp.]|nr:metalloregulator ArsR/SmtB family transcription factor [Fulvivirga sp.]
MSNKIDKIFKAIADPTRREIMNVLIVAATALSITQITAQFNISRQGITKHIKSLEDAGLINITEQGRERYCKATPVNLKVVHDWLASYERFWSDKLSNLGDFLDNKYN